ncbi:sensor histidine kinase [Paractinoplanes ferrugineus]|uniref:sensor histidine kinase n=1 Tax=Paractinoplanes ferrugineus TaxID=113564 RepID=UPI0019443DE2|nr:HAMP domain-containing sensor histidine kinase [Actinoplanes ferrugineus]
MPLRRSLIGRLLATSVLIAVAAIAATAWLAAQSTSRAIRQEQGRSLADDKGVYDMLVAYGATHRDWTGVQTLIEARSATIGRRITLTTDDREILADSGGTGSLATVRAAATVDPLRLDQALTGSADRIDERAVGPYKLPRPERDELTQVAQARLSCLRGLQVAGRVADDPSGRPEVQVTSSDFSGVTGLCAAKFYLVTATERRALRDLATMTARCLGLSRGTKLVIGRDFAVEQLSPAAPDRARDLGAGRVRSCIAESRARQLRDYVAPPALLFVTDRGGTAVEPVFRLSRANVLRIVGVTGAVLLATVLLTVLVGRRLVQPLRALTKAAAQPVERSARMPVARDDEIGYLARALNDLTERRERAEAQRRGMVSDIAHELRNPLTNIHGWLEAARDGVTPTGSTVLEVVREEATLLRHIVDDLSDLAAADAGELRLHREPVYAADLVTQVRDSHDTGAARAGVTLTARVAGDPVLSADPLRLRQMIGNLVANAIRYTPAGGTVTVTAAPAGAELEVVVRDTGVGIAADDLPRIFDRFWRADTSRARATGGSGLGLPIARQLAVAHGGTLTAVSRPGHGTTMTLRLPLDPSFRTGGPGLPGRGTVAADDQTGVRLQ